jgi:hypothetical protein
MQQIVETKNSNRGNKIGKLKHLVVLLVVLGAVLAARLIVI